MLGRKNEVSSSIKLMMCRSRRSWKMSSTIAARCRFDTMPKWLRSLQKGCRSAGSMEMLWTRAIDLVRPQRSSIGDDDDHQMCSSSTHGKVQSTLLHQTHSTVLARAALKVLLIMHIDPWESRLAIRSSALMSRVVLPRCGRDCMRSLASTKHR